MARYFERMSMPVCLKNQSGVSASMAMGSTTCSGEAGRGRRSEEAG